ncbi:type VI secretion system membrane subunit TssM [Pseudomonas sp. SWRI154]|uniref:type VI secretion system membrane subunit TssM n=1 Tax=Pseudomonas sp. SWRI154 TaxID=2745501 RepID=UPI001644AB5D|nr:type VI secretion system membrane subunit TssM [Pseudomonas sp. SWRI154]MBC3363634.1 type VI secretion system membrane subunit TssM [Pseudomonas sp. SWRI154]
MKMFFREIEAWLRRTWVWTLSCVLCVGLLVWFFGPLLAVDDYKFWASPTARLLTICVLFLGWGLGMVLFNERADSNKKPQQTDAQSPRIFDQTRSDDERRELRSRFRQALRVLKTSSLYHDERERNDLPWYLLVGPLASGKTSLLRSSGLDFSLNRLDKKTLADVSGTRNCDWYFAQQAVLIDTAGRYLNQADTDVDASAWNVLLQLLRKYRRGRPLSGVLVTVPVEFLWMGSEDEVATLACQIRGRLQEVQRQLRVDVPIYLVLSKADSLPGFSEFFDTLTREENDQVLGMSFSRDQRGSDLDVLRAEFEALLHRLNSQLLMRLHQERDIGRRGLILDFPQRLAQIGPNMCLLVDLAFNGDARPLRGVYLTCASPPPRLVASTGPDHARPRVSSDALPSREGHNGRFIHHLFTRIIFPEAGLASPDRRDRRRLYWGQRALYIGALTTLGLFGLLWANGFSANHQRLESLRTMAQRWDQQRSAQTAIDDSMAMLEALDIRFEATKVFPPAKAVPLYERIGLYQGEASRSTVLGAYEHELLSQLLPRVAKMLEGHIHDNLNEREQLLNSLRAYLMLAQPERRDNAWLKTRVAREWSQRYPGNTGLQSGLLAHFERLLEQPFIHSLNDSLVVQSRETLRSESLATVVYRMLREQASHLPQYRLSQHLGPQGSLLVGADHLIPGFYTRQGYEQYFSVQGMTLVTGLLRDNWVLGGDGSLSGMDLRRLRIELEQLYFHDYADVWGEAIGQVGLQPVRGAGEAAEQLVGLTSAHSPVLQLLVQVRENTRIPSVAERIEDAAQVAGNPIQLATIASKVSGSVARDLPDTGQKALQRRFEPLHRLLDADNGPAADLTLALRALEDTQLQMASLARASAPEHAAFELAKSRMGGQRDALSNLRSASARLPRPISGWFSGLAEDSWRLVLSDSYRYLNQRYQNELYSFYGKAINKRYPFSALSVSDVAISDFREFFKDQGVVDRFFESYMRPFVTGQPGHYRLLSVDGQSLPMSRAYLDQMATVHTIRQSFFVDNPAEPQVQFKLEPYTLDPAVSRSEFRFGDKILEYRHGPIQPMTFTWPIEAQDGRASLLLERMAGGRGIGIEKNTGPWSLFRLLDIMQTEYLTGRDVRVLKADLGGLRANYLLMSQRTPNPFDMAVLRTFKMPVQL